MLVDRSSGCTFAICQSGQRRDFSTYLRTTDCVPLDEGSVITDAWPNAVHMVVKRNNTRVSDMMLVAEIPNILIVEGEQCRGYFLCPRVIVIGTDRYFYHAETSIHQ